MKKTYFLLILTLAGCSGISDGEFTLEGKWYVHHILNKEDGDVINLSFIECPYMEFSSNNVFRWVNGTGMEDSTWELTSDSTVLVGLEEEAEAFTILVGTGSGSKIVLDNAFNAIYLSTECIEE